MRSALEEGWADGSARGDNYPGTGGTRVQTRDGEPDPLHHGASIHAQPVVSILTESKAFLRLARDCGACRPAATAALKKYEVRKQLMFHYAQTSPKVELRKVSGFGKGLIDEAAGPNPVLKKLITVTDGGRTVVTPPLSGGFIWFNEKSLSGPGPDEVGTGSTASSIYWGDVESWSVTGGTYCNANPSYICSLALVVQDETLDPPVVSSHYDIGTWTFHGTGWRSNLGGFVHRTGSTDDGNLMWNLWGTEAADGTVPALPLLGIGAIGASVISMGIAMIRRRKE